MTSSLWMPLAGLAGGLVLLAWSADRFVDGAAAVARNLGVAPLVVGLVVVGFGTSAPELLVSAVAAWDGRPGLAIGNAVGSNIVNIALILGAAALARPLEVRSDVLRRELPVPLLAMLLALMLLLDGVIGRADGAVLLLGFLFLLAVVTRVAARDRRRPVPDPMSGEYAARLADGAGTARAVFRVVLGLLLLLVSSRVLVGSAVEIAEWLGLSDLVIGLTVVAVGTGLPELAACVAAALKGQHDIAIGNIVGSNTFNILAAVGTAGLIRPGPIDPEVLTRDFPVMIGLTLALFVMATGIGGPGRINRAEGTLLVAAYAAYVTLLLAAPPA
jgi:cation:H+ antiporter